MNIVPTNSTSLVEKKHSAKSQKLDPLFIAWYLILQGVNTQQQGIQAVVDNLHANTKAQNQMADEINSIVLNPIPPLVQKKKREHGVDIMVNVNSAEVSAIQTENQQLSKIQNQDEDVVVILRQQFQMQSTSVSTKGQNMLQLVQEGSNLINILEQVSLRITNKQNLG